MSDGIEMRVRLCAAIDRGERFERYSFKVGDSCGQPVIAQTWVLGSRGAMARVDGDDPGDEHNED